MIRYRENSGCLNNQKGTLIWRGHLNLSFLTWLAFPRRPDAQDTVTFRRDTSTQLSTQLGIGYAAGECEPHLPACFPGVGQLRLVARK